MTRSAAEEAALRRAISPDRIGTYRRAAAAAGCDELDLYVWDRDLGSAVLADIAIVEVALRNAVHAALTAHVGTGEWFTHDIGLDDRSRRALAAAWGQLPTAKRTPGRVIARLMFGFWAGLLDAGGYHGAQPQAFKADYEQLFRAALRPAFPGGRAATRAAGTAFTRQWLHSSVTIVGDLRNRAAHHEPLVAGFPLNGQRDKHGRPTRLTADQGHQACLRLARILDRDLATWMAGTSAVPGPTRPPSRGRDTAVRLLTVRAPPGRPPRRHWIAAAMSRFPVVPVPHGPLPPGCSGWIRTRHRIGGSVSRSARSARSAETAIPRRRGGAGAPPAQTPAGGPVPARPRELHCGTSAGG